MKRNTKLMFATLLLVAANLTAQVGIGEPYIDESAMLDVSSTHKGILLPRIPLTSVTGKLGGNSAPQPAGLLIYNTSPTLPEGFYFWDGAEWKNFESSLTVAPAIDALICHRAILEPPTLKAGAPYSGLLKIPYTGGNGGKYSTGSWTPSTGNTGLRMRLKPGLLAYGAGELVYDVEGIPAYDTPMGATFKATDFAGNPCAATVGVVQNVFVSSVATVGPLTAISGNAYIGYERAVDSPDGKFSVRVFIVKDDALQYADIQIRSNNKPVEIRWNAIVSWNGGHKGTGDKPLYLPSAGIWYGNDGDNGDVVTTGSRAAWGDQDVYFTAPEQRRYVWTATGSGDDTVYALTFMMGAPDPNLLADTVSAAKTKAFLRIEQISAALH
ncbi:MAG: hypothetical protein LBS05_10300 [Tannerellaceae bacterium]|jgi:hypothetical protein|nr:hypothetical protein [Tannerellaceae bacterium]